jgi:hypothetical protein
MSPPERESDMSNNKVHALRADREVAASTTRELAALDKMSVGELAERYREVFGEPTRTRNKGYLRKRIAWGIQQRAEASVFSPHALERIEQLAPEAPARWRQPVARKDGASAPVIATAKARDPRLPPVGTVLTRVHDGVEHKVTVLVDDGFEHNGKQYRSLSKIARVITGTPWNGFLFFFGRGHGARNSAEERAG